MNAGLNSKQRYQDKHLINHNAIRECAAKILEMVAEGKNGKPEGFTAGHYQRAMKLLHFEGLIKKRNDFTLSHKGETHVKKHGFILYPP